jgi:HTH-type transcriptional regulator/antitoxin HipB
LDYPIKTLSQLRPILQGFRKTAGLTQAMMASRLGVTQQTYAQLEANPSSASVERLFKVLRALNVGLALTQSGQPPSKAAHAETANPRSLSNEASKDKTASVRAARISSSEKVAMKKTRATAAIKGSRKPKSAAGKSQPEAASAVGKKRENW